MQKQAMTSSSYSQNPGITLRCVVTLSNNKWKACIYSSKFDQTSAIILLLHSIHKNTTGKFQNRPAQFFVSTQKNLLEIRIQKYLAGLKGPGTPCCGNEEPAAYKSTLVEGAAIIKMRPHDPIGIVA